jgi:hypothetical protein
MSPDERIAALKAQAQAWACKLDGQGGARDGVKVGWVRQLSDNRTKARLHHEVKEAHLAKIVNVDLKGVFFSYAIAKKAL